MASLKTWFMASIIAFFTRKAPVKGPNKPFRKTVRLGVEQLEVISAPAALAPTPIAEVSVTSESHVKSMDSSASWTTTTLSGTTMTYDLANSAFTSSSQQTTTVTMPDGASFTETVAAASEGKYFDSTSHGLNADGSISSDESHDFTYASEMTISGSYLFADGSNGTWYSKVTTSGHGWTSTYQDIGKDFEYKGSNYSFSNSVLTENRTLDVTTDGTTFTSYSLVSTADKGFGSEDSGKDVSGTFERSYSTDKTTLVSLTGGSYSAANGERQEWSDHLSKVVTMSFSHDTWDDTDVGPGESKYSLMAVSASYDGSLSSTSAAGDTFKMSYDGSTNSTQIQASGWGQYPWSSTSYSGPHSSSMSQLDQNDHLALDYKNVDGTYGSLDRMTSTHVTDSSSMGSSSYAFHKYESDSKEIVVVGLPASAVDAALVPSTPAAPTISAPSPTTGDSATDNSDSESTAATAAAIRMDFGSSPATVKPAAPLPNRRPLAFFGPSATRTKVRSVLESPLEVEVLPRPLA